MKMLIKKPAIIVLYLVFVLIINSIPGHGQIQVFSATRTTLDPQGTAIGYYTIINEIPYQTGLKGSEYLDEEWRIADIILSHDSSKYAGIPARINVRKNVVEVRINGDISLLALPAIYSLYFRPDDALFLTSSILDCELPYGFYEVIYNERSALLRRYFIRVKPSNYTLHFDVGERDNRLMIDCDYYALMDGEVIHLNGRCKKLAEQFRTQEDLAEFILENRITSRDEDDLIDFLSFFDSICP